MSGPGLCRGSGKPKRRFASERTATRALDRIWRNALKGRQRNPVMPCRVYECPFCKGWHFTSQPKIK